MAKCKVAALPSPLPDIVAEVWLQWNSSLISVGQPAAYFSTLSSLSNSNWQSSINRVNAVPAATT